MSITLSASHTDKPSLAACPLVARALSLLLPYFCIINLWYLQKIKKYYSETINIAKEEW